MSHAIEREGSHLAVRVEGRLDAKTAPVIRDDIAANLDGITSITFDVAGLEYVSSAGLRVLLAAYKLMMKREGAMRLVNAGDNVMSVLVASGFADLFAVE